MDTDTVYHRPISVTLLSVGPVPYVRELPQTTELRINLKMGWKESLELVGEIVRQKLLHRDFVEIELKTRVP